MLLVGESINGTRKQVAEAIQARDAEFIKSLALDQVNAGANVLDVNGGVAGGNEVEATCTVTSSSMTRILARSPAAPTAPAGSASTPSSDAGR